MSINFRIMVSCCIFLFSQSIICAGPIGTLESSSRKQIREAELSPYGNIGETTSSSSRGGALTNLDSTSRRLVREVEMEQKGKSNQNPGLLIQNTIEADGHKKCVVSAGQVMTGEVKRGSTVENRTIVTGDVINVCQ